MSLGARLGILGGTLDPVHVGHVETALAARDALALDRVLLLPSRIPPHRPLQPSASPFHRFAMAALAVNGIEGVEASDIELGAPGPSYTASTLERFHESGTRPSQIFFILGADAFAEIETWNRYPRVLDMANFVVVSRPGYDSHRIVESLPALPAGSRPPHRHARALLRTREFSYCRRARLMFRQRRSAAGCEPANRWPASSLRRSNATSASIVCTWTTDPQL